MSKFTSVIQVELTTALREITNFMTFRLNQAAGAIMQEIERLEKEEGEPTDGD